MWQGSLFGEELSARIVNVASVPQLSPFRYPGGKTWFIPYIRHWLSPVVRQKYHLTPIHPEHFIEPFAGGGSISLAVASECMVPHVTMVELDSDIAAVWQTVLDAEDGNWLAREILAYDLTLENITSLLGEVPATARERALQTVVRNRVTRGGILAPGVGLLNCGENGKGIRSRWYPQTLAKRIHRIIALYNQITFICGDGLQTLAQHLDEQKTVYFIDPPYTADQEGRQPGKRLYPHNTIDHQRLFDLTDHIRGDFLMTYDNNDTVQRLAVQHGLDIRLIPMKNTHHAEKMELLIGRNLDWVLQAWSETKEQKWL